MKDEQLIFYIAVPGSGWAKLSLLLGCCAKLNLNKSDRRPDREERGKQGDCGVVFHKGAYWDPQREFGDGFDDIGANYTKESFIEECLKPFDTINDQNYLIRSHFFAETKNLEWLTSNFPNNKIIFVLREVNLCYEGWTTGMTFTGHYPNYKAWMRLKTQDDHPYNYEKLMMLIRRHDKMIREFVRDNDCYIIQPNKSFINKLGYVWDEEGKEEYMKLIMTHQFFKSEVPMFDAPFVFYNCNDLFTIQS